MKEWQKRSEDILAQGSTGTNSKRLSQYVKGVYPTHLVKADGPYVWDDKGRRYIDFVGGLGAIILGNGHPRVMEAVQYQLRRGITCGSLPSTLEIETAELVRSIFPQMEKIRFLKTGSEACSAAIRIARAYTNNSYVLSEGYHGHHDIFTSLTPPACGVKDDFKIVKNKARNNYGSTACYITEPVMLTDSDERKNCLKNKMEYTRLQKGLVIFDEVVTGCRTEYFSVANKWEMDPEIMVLGKAIANGFPLSVVGGKKDVMDSKEYFISSTFSGETIGLAACKATLEELQTKSLKDLNFYAKRFVNKFNDICAPIEVKIEGWGPRGMLSMTDYKTALVAQEMCKAGVIFGKAFFYHFGHMETPGMEEIVFNVLSDAVERIKADMVQLEGELPKETFVR